MCAIGVQGQPSKVRGPAAAAAAGLVICRSVEIIPREGKPALMHVYVMRKAREVLDCRPNPVNALCTEQQQAESRLPSSHQQEGSHIAAGKLSGCDETFTIRTRDGSLSKELHAARQFMGLPPEHQRS